MCHCIDAFRKEPYEIRLGYVVQGEPVALFVCLFLYNLFFFTLLLSSQSDNTSVSQRVTDFKCKK